MEVILTIVLIVVVAFLVYKAFASKLDTNKDGKIDQAEIKAVVEEVKVVAEKTKAAAKKVTTRKPRVTK